MDAEQIKALIEAIKNKDGDAALAIAEAMLVSAASGESTETGANKPAMDPLAANPEPKPEEVALSAALVLLTGESGPAEQTVVINKIRSEKAAIEAEKIAVELSSRLELVGELVKLGVEFPSTAFGTEPEKKILVERLSSEPIDSLRSRVRLLKATGLGAKKLVSPPERTAEIAELSSDILAQIKAKGMTPEQFITARNSATKRST